MIEHLRAIVEFLQNTTGFARLEITSEGTCQYSDSHGGAIEPVPIEDFAKLFQPKVHLCLTPSERDAVVKALRNSRWRCPEWLEERIAETPAIGMTK